MNDRNGKVLQQRLNGESAQFYDITNVWAWNCSQRSNCSHTPNGTEVRIIFYQRVDFLGLFSFFSFLVAVACFLNAILLFCGRLHVLTSSITKVQSLSSSSCVRGSLNRVTDIVWLSGTAHEIWPTSGFTISGSHGNGVDATRRDRLVHTIDKFVGRLQITKSKINQLMRGRKSFSSFVANTKYPKLIQSFVGEMVHSTSTQITCNNLKLHIFTKTFIL